MPRRRLLPPPPQQHDPGGGDCACCCLATPSSLQQTLSELGHARSAAAAAAAGDLPRLREMILKDRRAAVAPPRGSTDGFAPLHHASRSGNLEAVSMLLEAGADPNAETIAGKATPLHRAAFAGCVEVCELLLWAGAEAARKDADGETAAFKAASQGHEALMRLLLEAAPEAASARDSRRGRTPEEALRERREEREGKGEMMEKMMDEKKTIDGMHSTSL